MNFEVNLSNQLVFPTWPKSHDKNLNILRKKGAFDMKRLLMKQITILFER